MIDFHEEEEKTKSDLLMRINPVCSNNEIRATSCLFDQHQYTVKLHLKL